MSYLSFRANQANEAAAFSFVCSSIVSMGWTLHDDISSTKKVYKSNGESGDRIYEYIEIETNSGISFKAHGYWNNSTHVGSCSAYNTNKVNTSYPNHVSVFGDKNLVIVRNHGNSSYYGSIYFGHIPSRFYTTPLGTLSNNESSGTDVVVELDSVTGFKKSFTYMIFGAAGEGRDNVLINDVNTGSNTITIANLPRNYNSGSKIGITPSTFGSSNSYNNNFFPTCHRNFAGGTGAMASGNTWSSLPFLYRDYFNPTINGGLYGLCQLYWTEDNVRDTIGYCDSNILYSPLTTDGSIFGIKSNLAVTGTATGGSSTTLVDGGKSWTVNAWQNKFVVISDGTGGGQTRQILSNDATTLTVNTWFTNPSTDSIYYIVDEVYRILTMDSFGCFCAKEIL
jgi:hypothetical protein